jgi:hypothetical protein
MVVKKLLPGAIDLRLCAEASEFYEALHTNCSPFAAHFQVIYNG